MCFVCVNDSLVDERGQRLVSVGRLHGGFPFLKERVGVKMRSEVTLRYSVMLFRHVTIRCIDCGIFFSDTASVRYFLSKLCLCFDFFFSCMIFFVCITINMEYFNPLTGAGTYISQQEVSTFRHIFVDLDCLAHLATLFDCQSNKTSNGESLPLCTRGSSKTYHTRAMLVGTLVLRKKLLV